MHVLKEAGQEEKAADFKTKALKINKMDEFLTLICDYVDTHVVSTKKVPII